jgi:hypothetical protein
MCTIPRLEEYKMGNQLFQEARRFVELAKAAGSIDRESTVAKAKNALSSAFANSTVLVQRQLHQMQNELEQVNQMH